MLREALAAVLLAAGQVQRVGVNLNQAVAALNSGELVEQLRWYAQAAARAIERLDGLAQELRHRLLRMFRCPDSAMSMGSDQPSSARCVATSYSHALVECGRRLTDRRVAACRWSGPPHLLSPSLGVPVLIGVRFWLTGWLLGLGGADSGGARHADDLEYPIPRALPESTLRR